MKTRVLIENCGDFVKMIQPSSCAEIMIDPSEWPYIRDAINNMCETQLENNRQSPAKEEISS